MQKKKGDEPQTHLLFWLRGSGLGARKPANPYCTVSLAPSFRGFSPMYGSGLGTRKPAKPYCTVSLAPSFRGFSLVCDSGLGARKPTKPYCTVSLAPNFRAFRRCAPLLWAFPQIIKQKQINIQLFLQLMKSTVLYSLRILQALVCCSIYTV